MLKNKTVRNVFLTVFLFFVCLTLAHAESCSTKGQIQYKTNGSCGTSTRTCCSNGSWSDWDGSCPVYIACNSANKPATTQACGGGNGTQTRTVSCNTTTGAWVTGSWRTCTCTSGFFWDSDSSMCLNLCYCGWRYQPSCPYWGCKELCCPYDDYDMDNATCGGVFIDNFQCTGGIILRYPGLWGNN